MTDEHPERDLELRRRFEDLDAQLSATRADIDALQTRAEQANHRADASEDRADQDRRRIDDLEAHVDVDREMILQLQADGLLSQKQVAQLEETLRSSRKIGAAMGIVMANRRVSEPVAFEIPSQGSQRVNRKLRLIADEVMHTGDVSTCPACNPPRA